MTNDIRVLVTFPRHPKIRKLRMRLGADAVVSLLTLWLWARENRPEGDLSNMSVEDVCLASEWQGEIDEFVSCLVELCLLDEVDSGWVIHNWEKNNPWSAGAKMRHEKAKKAAISRWEKRDKKQHVNATSIKKDATSKFEQCPSPSPLLSNTENTSLSSSNGTTKSEPADDSCDAPRGESERSDVLSSVMKMHFSLFGYALKPAELKKLEQHSPPKVELKYQEAMKKQGTDDPVRSFSWIVNGLEMKPRKSLKRLLGFGGDNEEVRGGRRVDVGG